MSEMTDEQVNEVLERFMGWIRFTPSEEIGEQYMDGGGLVLDDIGGAFTESLDACREAELKLKREHPSIWDAFEQRYEDLSRRSDLGYDGEHYVCPHPALVAHALAEVIRERGLVLMLDADPPEPPDPWATT